MGLLEKKRPAIFAGENHLSTLYRGVALAQVARQATFIATPSPV
jgi:hypothetical protein